MDFKEYFLTNNKSGFKSKESYLQKNNPELHQQIIDFNKINNIETKTFAEAIWYFINNQTKNKKCSCGNSVKFRNLTIGFQEYCSRKCANTNEVSNSKRKETNIKKYGNEYAIASKKVKVKIHDSFKEKYGTDNPFKNKDIQEKIKTTNLNKFGGQPMNSNKVKEKFKKTMMENYNVEYSSQIPENKEKLKKRYLVNLIESVNDKFVSINGNEVTLECCECHKSYTADRSFINQRKRLGMITCIHCNPIGFVNTSTHEKEIAEFLNENNIDFTPNDRTVISPHELDFYIPDQNVGIELNGVYFHSEVFKDSKYHLDKTKKFSGQLLHIFEDEWIYKKDIIKSIIRQTLKLPTEKIFGRKCIIKEVSNVDSKNFLNENHIQGNVNTNIRYGLYYNDELVSLMTFGGLRKSLGTSAKENEYELLRFCNKINTTIVGGASKLFKHFLANNHPEKIISYSDKRLFSGGLYEQLGFIKKEDTQPNYFYIKNGIRENRFKYRKSELVKEGFDSSKTEHQIMIERKMYRIYDCGNFKFEFKS